MIYFQKFQIIIQISKVSLQSGTFLAAPFWHTFLPDSTLLKFE